MNEDKDYYILVDADPEWRSLENGVIWVLVKHSTLSNYKMVSTLGNHQTNPYRHNPAHFSNGRMRRI